MAFLDCLCQQFSERWQPRRHSRGLTRGQWLRARNAGRAAFRRQLERQGLQTGALHKRSAWFNTETAELELNDLFRFIRDLLHSEFLKQFLREAGFAILDEFSNSDSDQ